MNKVCLSIVGFGFTTFASANGFLIAGAGAGGGPQVKVFNASTLAVTNSFFAYSASFTGGVRVGGGDITGDGKPDLLTGSGPTGGPHVESFDQATGSTQNSFFAFSPSDTNGVYVTSARIAGSARMIVGTGEGSVGTIGVFTNGGTSQTSFSAFGAGFTGGVRVAAGDLNGTGTDEIIAAPGSGGGAIRIFDASGNLQNSFSPFSSGFTGGMFVASGDVNGDGKSDIIVGADQGGISAIRVFSGSGFGLLSSFTAFDASFTGGVRVAAGDINGDGKADIIAGTGPGGVPDIKVFSGADQSILQDLTPFSSSFAGGVYVGFTPSAVPEPASLLALGLGSLALLRRRKIA